MAQAATPTIIPSLTDVGHRVVRLRGTLAISGTYAAGGPTLDLTKFAGFPVPIGASAQVRLWGTGASNHSYGYTAGTNLTDGKVLCTVTSTGVELANGAVPAAITGDTIQFEITLPKSL